MAEKQSCVFFSTSATAAATDDSTKRLGQRKASAWITGCGGNSTPNTASGGEIGRQTAPESRNPDTQRPVEEIDVEYVEKVVDVNEDSAKSS